jgi:hypothetical protein
MCELNRIELLMEYQPSALPIFMQVWAESPDPHERFSVIEVLWGQRFFAFCKEVLDKDSIHCVPIHFTG